MIKQPAFNLASLNSLYAPTYLMSFQYQGSQSYFDLLAPPGSRDLLDPGVSHGDDLLYLFYTGVLELGKINWMTERRKLDKMKSCYRWERWKDCYEIHKIIGELCEDREGEWSGTIVTLQ